MVNSNSNMDTSQIYTRESCYGTPINQLRVSANKIVLFKKEKAHAHDELELIFVNEGECLLNVNGVDFSLKKGTLAYLRPFHVHSLSSKFESAVISYCRFPLSMLLYFSIDKEALKTDYEIIEFSPPCLLLTGEQETIVANKFQELIKENENKDVAWELAVLSCLSGLLSIYKRESMKKLSDYKKIIRPISWNILQHISTKFNSKIDSASTAKKFNISASQVNGYIRMLTGKNFSQTLMIVRMRNACALMAFNTLPINVVANKVGYSSVSSFSRDFKKITGQTPVEYQNGFDDSNPFDQSTEQSFEIFMYIAENYQEDITIESAAKAMFMSKNTLSALIYKVYNSTFQEVLTQMRILVAAGLLLSTTIDINEISVLVGFNNPRSFNRLFQDEFGCTPTAFRKSGTAENRQLIQDPLGTSQSKPL